MGIVVQKFGGTSVGSPERIHHVADLIINEYKRGSKVVAVVSAMGHTTDELVHLANCVSEVKYKREMDMLLSTGEQVSIALLTMALKSKGMDAISLTGWQAGIETESFHGNARIENIRTDRMKSYLDEGKVLVVAGFQGMSAEGEITTLGRGGSDTTAVAIAAALEADVCDIYTDVQGVYTTDPRVVSTASKLDFVSYEEMLEFANLGAGVIHPRAVEFAKNYHVKVSVRSSMESVPGTVIGEEEVVENQSVVKGIAFEEDVTKVTVKGLPITVDGLSVVFSSLANKGVNVDIIIQHIVQEKMNISFSIKTEDLQDTLVTLEDEKHQLQFDSVQYEKDLCKVSIVGSGMVSNPGVAALMFNILAEEGILVKMVSTSEIKVSTVITQESMKKAVCAIHDGFRLEAKAKDSVETM
ncbi:aspartate kinase [Priestia taiwanensis]|uniref:Aspartokinase n=1 Tax=Priestia taiwanensis TaxID=1347902 RepID=A0A917AVT9_9BACI|nr:aspartate kinase [Priestia taiwanensis]MBM7363530.1 aspartate kinase [Priestia taiwanensis]GGE76352.1 aspartokinase [Priestia taiwanensis]